MNLSAARLVLISSVAASLLASLVGCSQVEAITATASSVANRATGGGGGVPPGAGALAPKIDAAAVKTLLDTLPVKGRAPKTGYERTVVFGNAWTDNNGTASGHNGCDTRDDILARDLTDIKYKDGSKRCVVASGVLNDPYTGKVIQFVRGPKTSSEVQIDHVVPLSNAWQTGAQGLSQQERVNLANDPLNLLAVDGTSNIQKSDGDAATWLPPNKGFRCAYVARQVKVKAVYRLWVVPAERDAILRVLSRC